MLALRKIDYNTFSHESHNKLLILKTNETKTEFFILLPNFPGISHLEENIINVIQLIYILF